MTEIDTHHVKAGQIRDVLLLMAAGIGVVVAITREANRLEAQRQAERIEAAINGQIKLSELRLERLVAAVEGIAQAAG